jgi:hypothetical protein
MSSWFRVWLLEQWLISRVCTSWHRYADRWSVIALPQCVPAHPMRPGGSVSTATRRWFLLVVVMVTDTASVHRNSLCQIWQTAWPHLDKKCVIQNVKMEQYEVLMIQRSGNLKETNIPCNVIKFCEKRNSSAATKFVGYRDPCSA